MEVKVSVLKNNSSKYLAAYLFFLCVTTGRFFFEAHYAHFVDTKNLIFHHHYWFLFVFLLFLINFKYFLRLHPSKIWWTAFLSPVIFTPLIYNMIFRGGNLVKFNYLSAKESDYIMNIFTFMLFSKENKPVGIELIIITFSIFLFSYFISKRPLHSFICALSCYISLMVLAGTVIIAPHEPDLTLFFINSSFKLQNFMSFVYFSASTIAVLFHTEILEFFREKKKQLFLVFIFLIIFTTFQFILTEPSITDRILMIPHSFLFSIFLAVIVFARKDLPLQLLLLLVLIAASGILFQLFFTPSRKHELPERTKNNNLDFTIEQKIENGISILSSRQQENGEFTSVSCRTPDRKQCSVHKGSVFIPTFILYSLNFVKNNANAHKIIRKGTGFIRSEKGNGDLWRFWGDRIDYDLDDTSCSSFILELSGETLSNKKTIYSNRDQDGLFKTWIRNSQKNDVDSVVNSNVLLYLGENEMTAPACNALVDAVMKNKETSMSYYYPEIAVFYYTLSRAYFEKQLKCVEKGIPPIVKKVEKMLNDKNAENDIMIKVMLLNTLLNFNRFSDLMDISAEILLKTDLNDLFLAKKPFFVAGEPPDKPSFYYFSNETTIALSIEFLSRYLTIKKRTLQ